MKDINIEEILNKAKDMQGQFQKMQETFTHKEIQGIAGIDDADQVVAKVTVDGMRKIKTLHIGDGALRQGKAVLADLIKGAVNNATDKLNEEMQREVKKIYAAPGMLPGSEPKQDDE